MGFESLILHQIWLHSIMVSIAACHAVDRSSILLEAARLESGQDGNAADC